MMIGQDGVDQSGDASIDDDDVGHGVGGVLLVTWAAMA